MALTLSDDYLIGFIEGEGTFYIGIVPSRETRSGWQVIHFFSVSQNPQGKVVLDQLKKRLQCGYIKRNAKETDTDKSLVYTVRDLPSLVNRVIPFLKDRLVVKRKAFTTFCRIIDLVKRKEHFTKAGMKEIIDLAYSMNSGKRRVMKNTLLAHFG